MKLGAIRNTSLPLRPPSRRFSEPAFVEEIKTPRIQNKEILLLIGLSLLAFGAFIFTRRMATLEQHLEARIAAFWYERGTQYMQAGNTAQAIQAFRKATADLSDSEKYTLALSDALAAANHDAEALQLLLRLGESDPGNIDINTRLARLTAKHGNVQEAEHYYQSALYANWSAGQTDIRRKLRVEFIRFLLANQQRDLAASELLVLQARAPDAPAAHIENAKFFAQADDPKRAFEEYAAAAREDGNNVEALTGAGESAFEAADYRAAEQYLRAAVRANPADDKTHQLLGLAEAILNEDPLATPLAPEERQRRLLAGLERSIQRLESCPNQAAESKANSEIGSLKAEAQATRDKLSVTHQPTDIATFQAGVGLIFRMQQVASGYCGKPTQADEALLLIGRQHNGERQ
jgi:Flp pilus assembly protein TadD